jgi:hypothetical protein
MTAVQCDLNCVLNTGPVIIASGISAWNCSRTKCRAGGCKVDEVTEGDRLHDFYCL